ncbi:hypothetical protein DAPPUDRAFT_100787 [Daphnia pulex]|uniref:non-specific serine/threonine protein kinase n=1 Tax=Daphnia pulex TaxID=6669 RepID=E9GC57_DAPPU|nr:hypothetical protein DAPPUDRAFT_100787 [Daphnia pulex]|eukprot:EFX83197.1 hypothetical protein DAPPUDRAFT_100787 [Daphnia pulex]
MQPLTIYGVCAIILETLSGLLSPTSPVVTAKPNKSASFSVNKAPTPPRRLSWFSSPGKAARQEKSESVAGPKVEPCLIVYRSRQRISWSTACVAFELTTYSIRRLASNIQRMRITWHSLLNCCWVKFQKTFWHRGNFRIDSLVKRELCGTRWNIESFKPWGLCNVLFEKYRWGARDTHDFAEFLHSMLAFDPKERATAAECLLHP